MKKITVSIFTVIMMISMALSSSVLAASANETPTSAWDSFVGLFKADAASTVGVEYKTHIQNIGWENNFVTNGEESGTDGQGLRLEAIKIDLLNAPAGLGIEYRTHVQNIGWEANFAANGNEAGTDGQGLRLEAIEIRLTGANAADYSVQYRTHIQNQGWEQDWATNGEESGTDGLGLRLEAIEIKIVQNAGDLTAYNAAKAAVTEADYTAASWTTYEAALAANVVTTDSLKSAITTATAHITAAQANLVKAHKADLTDYTAAVAQANAAVKADYTAASYTALQTAVKANVVTVENTQAEVDAATTAINNAYDALVLVPKVSSVTAINAAQAVVTFNSEVDATTVMDSTTKVIKNITFTPGINTTAIGTLTGVLSADKKSLTITNTSAFKGAYTVQTAKDLIKTTTATKFVQFTGLLNAADTTAPSIVKTEASGKVNTKTISVYFDEPINATGFIAYVNGEAATPVIDSVNPNRINITTTTALVAGTTSSISLTNVKDLAGNYTAPNPVLANVVIVADATVPTATSAVITDEKNITVTYDKEVLDSSFAGKARFNYNGGTSTGLTAAYAKDANNADIKNQIVLTNVAVATASVSGNLVLDAGVKDLAGNSAVAFTQAFTFTRDATAPTLASASFADGNITATFSEKIQKTGLVTVYAINTTTGASTTITLDYTTVGSINAVITDKTLVITKALADGTYTLQIPAGTVTDFASTPNNNTLGNQIFTVLNSATGDVTVPTATNPAGPAPIVGAVTTSEEIVTYTAADNVGLDLTTLLNTTNYTYNGKALPAGSYVTNAITYDATGTKAVSVVVSIHIPSIGITTTPTAPVPFTVNGVKDLAGNYIASVATSNITLYDGVAPVITAATVNTTTGTIVITPSETVTALNTLNFVVKAGTTTIAGTTTLGTGTDAGKLLFTPTTAADIKAATSAITVTTATDATALAVQTSDVQGNVLTFGTIITAV